MALRWVLHSACHVLGYPNKDTNLQCNNVAGYPNNEQHGNGVMKNSKVADSDPMEIKMNPSEFQMPLHYPRYTKASYEKMEEWRLDMLLREYGLNFKGSLEEKRAYAMGAFLWPDQF